MNSLFMRRAFAHGILLSIVAGIILSSMVFLFYPKVGEAQATNATGCAAALGLSAAAGAQKEVVDIPAVPVATHGGTITDVFKGTGSYSKAFLDCFLKPIAMALLKNFINEAGNSIVKWINDGFDGNPRFVTNFEDIFLDAADKAIGQFLDSTELGWLCDGFEPRIKLALGIKYNRPFGGYLDEDDSLCEFTDILADADRFFDGGWDNWIKVTTNPRYSAFGAYIIAEDELTRRVAAATGEKDKEITVSDGFKPDKYCETWETEAQWVRRTRYAPQTNENDLLSQGESAMAEAYQDERICKKENIVTPGKTIAGKLDSVLGQGEIQLAVADELDEIFAAAINQFAKMALENVRGLLSGSSGSKPYKRTVIGNTNYTATIIPRGCGAPDLNHNGECDPEDYLIQSQIHETGAQCSDGIDNDNDNLIDRTGGNVTNANGISVRVGADPDCIVGGIIDDTIDDITDSFDRVNDGISGGGIVNERNLLTSNSPVSASSGTLARNATDRVTSNPSSFSVGNNNQSNQVVTYTNRDYNGTPTIFTVNPGDPPRIFSIPQANTNTSFRSIKIPGGYKVTLYDGPNGTGASSIEYTQDKTDFGGEEFTNGVGIEDRVDSIRIESADEENANEINPPMRTNAGSPGWWQADLERRYIITRVVIYRNTLKTVPQTLGDSPLTVTVSDSSSGGGTSIPFSLAGAEGSNILTIAIPTNTIGRYVRITKNGQPGFPLEFTEVEVWGKPAPTGDQDSFYTICSVDTIGTGKCTADEKAVAISIGYRDGGVEGYVYPTQEVGTVPLYRMNSSGATDHAYTTDAGQLSGFRAAGFSDEGIEAYVYPPDEAQPAGTVPLYRLFSTIASDHFYTTSAGTRDRMISLGYVLEREDTGGIEAYVYPTRASGTVPFYKLLRGTY